MRRERSGSELKYFDISLLNKTFFVVVFKAYGLFCILFLFFILFIR